jgi:DNA polymerase III epsilon subunit-like protein
MKILFLDCETNDVTPLSGQIIEVGGLVAELDPTTLQVIGVDSFESLTRLRQTFDDKITRLTGITETELAKAPNLIDAQENWANWLDKHDREIVAICGHSIGFDLSFLRSESWFLPESAKIIDTLNLAKILFPHFSAVNLEFLYDKLNLEEYWQAEHATEPNQDSQAHRALYDSWCSAALFQSLLLFLKNHSFDRRLYAYLKTEVLPLDLAFYNLPATDLEVPTQPSDSETLTNYIDLTGQVSKINGNEKFNHICLQAGQPERQALLELLAGPLAGELKLIAAAAYVSTVYKAQNPQQHLKLHVYTNVEKAFVELLLESLSGPEPARAIDRQLPTVLTQFENLLWQIKQLSEEVVDFGKFINYLEVYQKLNPQKSSEVLSAALAAYDFFLLAIEPHWSNNRYQYWYRPKDLVGQELNVKQKFTKLLESVALLSKLDFSNTALDQVLKTKLDQFLKSLTDLEIRGDQNYYFRFVGQRFVVSLPKPGFSLNTHLENLFLQYPRLTVETYLSPDDFETLLKVAHIDSLLATYQVSVKYLNEVSRAYEKRSTDSLLELLRARQLTAIEKQAPVLILTGNNLALRKVQKTLTDNFQTKDYLALGESGSLTKVCSKMARGFIGLVNVRVGDFGFLNAQKNLPPLAEIWLVGEPFIFVQQYWQNLAKQLSEPQVYLHTIQDLNLRAQTGFIYHQTGQVVNYTTL